MATTTAMPVGPDVSLDDSKALHQSVAFFALTLGISWTLWLPLAFQDTLGLAIPDGLGTLPIIVGGFGPAIAAVIMTWRGDGTVRALMKSVLDWRQHPRWYLVALFLMPAMIPVGSAMYAANGGVLDLSVLVQRLPMYPVQFVFVLFLGGGQEELGWRGFALPRLQAAYGGTVASLVIGVVWAVWHLPVFAIPAASQYGQAFLPYAVGVLGFSVLLTWVFNGTGGSVLLAMLFHASVNTASTLYPIPVDVLRSSGFPDIVMLGMALATWVVALVVLFRDGRSLDPRRDAETTTTPP
jgi:membrane protease YdiL (CAAX protease family)